MTSDEKVEVEDKEQSMMMDAIVIEYEWRKGADRGNCETIRD